MYRDPVDPQLASGPGKLVILVAEDEPVSQLLLQSALTRAGFHALIAGDGAEAVTMVDKARRRDERISLVLMDIQMPRMDGLQAARRIRSMGVGPEDLPIVAFTAGWSEQRVRDCFAVGMQEAVGKPLDLQTLDDLLDRWCGTIRPSPDCPAPGDRRH